MKYTIKKQEIKNDTVADLEFDIREDDGTPIFSGVRPVVFPDLNDVENYIKTTAENIYISHKRMLEKAETQGFKASLDSIVNVEKVVDQKAIEKKISDLNKTVE